MVLDTGAKSQRVRDEISEEPSVQPVHKVRVETCICEPSPILVGERDIDDSFIVGHSTNGIVGTTTGSGGGQVVIGPTDNSFTVDRVFNINNIFNERFNYITDVVTSSDSYSQYTFVDDDNTTATISTGTIVISSTEVLQSRCLAYDSTNTYRITRFIPGSIGGTVIWSIGTAATPTGSITWEAISTGTDVTLSNPNKALFYKGTGSTGVATVTRVKIIYKT